MEMEKGPAIKVNAREVHLNVRVERRNGKKDVVRRKSGDRLIGSSDDLVICSSENRLIGSISVCFGCALRSGEYCEEFICFGKQGFDSLLLHYIGFNE